MDDTHFLNELRARCKRGEKLDYLFFWGPQASATAAAQACFSQWYEAPFSVDEQSYATAEHFMMAAKARLFDDQETLARILDAPDPSTAMALGRKVQNYDDALWQTQRYALVVQGNLAKFSQHPTLRAHLLASGDKILVEASPFDPVWGIALTSTHADAGNPLRWRGLNLLGFALMQVRACLRD